MAVAVIGLVGVLIGTVLAQLGAVFVDRRQARNESARWRRDQKVAAYDGAIRYLLRFSNRRSSLAVEGGRISSILSQEHVREMFDDLVEAQFWLHILTSRCGARQAIRVREAAATLDRYVGALTIGRATTPVDSSGSSVTLLRSSRSLQTARVTM